MNKTMKNLGKILLICALTLSTSAMAYASQPSDTKAYTIQPSEEPETYSFSQYQADAGISHPIDRNKQTRDIVHSIGTATLKGLNDKKYYYYDYATAGYDIPTKTIAISTNLQTTGRGSTVKAGIGLMNWNTETLTAVAYSSNVKLHDYTYVSSKNISNSKSYYPFVTNTTLGVLSGSIDWYVVDRL